MGRWGERRHALGKGRAGCFGLLSQHTHPPTLLLAAAARPPCRCSGNDAVNAAGEAAPLFRRCTMLAKQCGARAYGAARPRFEACTFEKCGEQGLKAMESSAPVLAG